MPDLPSPKSSSADAQVGGVLEEPAEPPQVGVPRSTHVTCLLVIFFVKLEVSILTLVIPLIATEFGVSLELASWVHLAPMFSGTMTAPTIGKIADMCGHATVWRGSVLLAVLATWLCAWSPSLPVLMIGRVLIGVSGAGIGSPSYALMTKGMEPYRRGVISSQMATLDALGSSTGVLTGGLLLEHLGWRWVFLLPAALLSLAFLSSWYTVPRSLENVHRSPSSAGPSSIIRAFDWLGATLFAVTSFCALLALNRGNELGWTSPPVLGLAGATALLSPIICWIELRAAHPILPFWLFGTRSRMLMLFTMTVTGATYGSSFLLVPIYLEDAMAMHPGNISRLLAPRPLVGCLASAVLSYLLDRKIFHCRCLARAGAVVTFVAYVVLNVAMLLPPTLVFYLAMEVQLVAQATGLFLTNLPTNAMLAALLPAEELANASAMKGVVGGIAGMLVQALNLSLIRAVGSEHDVDSYHPTWVMLLTLQVVVIASAFFVPMNADIGGEGYQRASKTPMPMPERQGKQAAVTVECIEAGAADEQHQGPHAEEDRPLRVPSDLVKHTGLGHRSVSPTHPDGADE